jgi:dipeptidyl aminopeptidase/acylaminoacyl peptidase
MNRSAMALIFSAFGVISGAAQVPDNLVLEGGADIPAALRNDTSRYLEFRSAAFNSWHPRRREMIISTRFADSSQLHLVKMPGGARRQLTFFPDPVAGGTFQPRTGEVIVFSQDAGGGEFYQLYRYDLANANVTLLTDGKSRNSSPRWSTSGTQFAYTSTRRTGKDTDVYLMNPAVTNSNQLLVEVSGGGWSVADWSQDDAQLLLIEYVSINESRLYVADVRTGAKELVTPATGAKISWSGAQFASDGKSIFVATDQDSEFQRLCRLDLATHQLTPLTPHLRWDVERFELSPDGKTIAFTSNEDGVSVLHLLDAKSARERPAPKLSLGVITGLEWHANNRDLGFTLSSARSPADAYSYNVKTGEVERWTESETGGLDAQTFIEPELIKFKSFDGLGISAFVYRPDSKRFPGPRPVLISIHGGPESQSRPTFQARNNYYLDQLGVALVYPNVRGSDGYGKTFLTLDNGFKREDSVKDIGAVIDWVTKDSQFDGKRIAVIGGSYGGYMVLASMVHFNDRLRCGVDVVGISSFPTFLKNTQGYRRDLRRAEYGDEREPAMVAHLERISPLTNVKKITKPLFVVQGRNDPRVPVTEAEQMVKAIRGNPSSEAQVWYLMAKDEGHGFAKKKNADFQFLSTILFFRKHLLN